MVATDPKPSGHEDFLAFMDLILPELDDEQFFELYYQRKRKDKWRRGQFFIHTLPPEYKKILTGSPKDPWFEDDWESVYEALDYLLAHI